jgi:hypothetical protein
MSILQNLSSIFDDLEYDPEDAKPCARSKPTLENIVRVVYQGSTADSGPWIAGGAGRQLALGETSFNDIDIWFRNSAQYEQVLNRLDNEFGSEMYETFSSDNARTYTAGANKIQLIRRNYYQSIDEVFKSFDFTCCQVAVDDDLTPYGPGLADAKSMKLVLNYFDERAFLARYAKYVGYGYVMDPKEFLAIIENRTLNYEFDGSTLGY